MFAKCIVEDALGRSRAAFSKMLTHATHIKQRMGNRFDESLWVDTEPAQGWALGLDGAIPKQEMAAKEFVSD